MEKFSQDMEQKRISEEKEPTKGINETDKMILESDGTRSW